MRRSSFLLRNRRGLGVIVQAPADSAAAIFAANRGVALPAAPGDPSTAPARAVLSDQVLQLKANALANVESTVRPDLIPIGGVMPADARPIVQAAAVAYPAAGATAKAILTYTPQAGTVLVITQLAISHIGGNPPDFQGNVIWRLSLEGVWVKGMEAMQYQTGTQQAPAQISPLIVLEGQSFQVTVEVPSGQVAPGAGTQTAARFLGYTYPTARLYQASS
jgi:hypothetical protein